MTGELIHRQRCRLAGLEEPEVLDEKFLFDRVRVVDVVVSSLVALEVGEIVGAGLTGEKFEPPTGRAVFLAIPA